MFKKWNGKTVLIFDCFWLTASLSIWWLVKNKICVLYVIAGSWRMSITFCYRQKGIPSSPKKVLQCLTKSFPSWCYHLIYLSGHLVSRSPQSSQVLLFFSFFRLCQFLSSIHIPFCWHFPAILLHLNFIYFLFIFIFHFHFLCSGRSAAYFFTFLLWNILYINKNAATTFFILNKLFL